MKVLLDDSGVPYLQNLASLPLSVIILTAESNDIDDLHPLIPKVQEALKSLVPRTVVRIG